MEFSILGLRIIVNDLDSICAALALELIDPDTKPLAVLLGIPGLLGHEPGPVGTMH